MPTENRSSTIEQHDHIEGSLGMVSDKLPPCADDVFKDGVSACLVGDVPKHAAETICRSLSAVTGWKIDWHYIGGRTHIKALAPTPQPELEPIAWEPVTRPGQIQPGDWLSFMVSGRIVCAQARLILNPGTPKEEVVYNRLKNHYFITAMAVDGTSTHKGVLVAKAKS